jgi:hypothetical protein
MCLVSKKKYLEVVEQNKTLSDYAKEVSNENDVLTNENDQLRVEVEELNEQVSSFSDAFELLIKELFYCWKLRIKHEEDRNETFSEIEWEEISNTVREGLEACLLEEQTPEDLNKIERMSDLVEQFNGEL